jgi:CheY-like chemotaxis protein
MSNNMNNKKENLEILVVDDQESNLVALQAVFSGSGYNLIEATSGAEAISILKNNPNIAVILLDVQMPNMDGFQTATLIKQMEEARDIPIIFITAIYREDPFVRKGYQVGAVDYFSKPFDPEILRMKVAIYAAYRQKSNLLREREMRIRESEELLKAGRKLSAILESLPVGVIIADVNGRVCQTNEEVFRLFKSAGAVESDSYGEVLGWWDHSGQMIKGKDGPLSRALAEGESCQNQVLDITCFDGTSKTILCSASPLRGLDGTIVGAGVVIQDVTEPKRFEKDLEQRILKLISIGVELHQTTHH